MCEIESEGRAPGWGKSVSVALMRNLIKATVRILLFYSHLSYSVRARLSFRVSLPPKRHLQINEKCHNWFYSSKTTACQLCHKLSLLFSVFQVQHPHVVDSYWLVRALSCVGSGKPSDNDLLFVLLLCVLRLILRLKIPHWSAFRRGRRSRKHGSGGK